MHRGPRGGLVQSLLRSCVVSERVTRLERHTQREEQAWDREEVERAVQEWGLASAAIGWY